MTVFYQATGAVLLTAILTLVFSSQGKETGMVLALAGCGLVLVIMVSFLEPVMTFLKQLLDAGQLDESMVRILMKTAGIAILSETAALVCADSGNSSLGKALQMLGTAVILWLSIPVFQSLLELIQGILGGI